MHRPVFALAFALLLFAPPAAAQVRATDVWVRGTVPGQSVTGAFMTLFSPVDATLVGATSPVAGAVEIHRMTMEGGVMRMRPVAGVPLVAEQPQKLEPGGYHLMLMALKAPLSAQTHVPITLTFEDAAGKRSEIEVRAAVRPLGAAPAKHGH